MMKMTFKDVFFWYKIHERQIAEEIIINEYAKKDKEVPSAKRLETLVNKKIQEWYDKES